MAYSPQAVADHFRVNVSDLKPSYDLTPGRSIAVVRLVAGTGQRELTFLHWGLIPPRTKDPGVDDRMIFARAEAVMQKPALKDAFCSRRCLIPADGFYEWQKEHGHKQPFLVRMRNGHVFPFGGIWERCERADGKAIESCAILTTESNDLVRPLHDRMPLIIRPEDYDRWLDPKTAIESLEPLFRPYPAREMTSYPVSESVKNPERDDDGGDKPAETKPGEEGDLFRPVVEEMHRPARQEQSKKG